MSRDAKKRKRMKQIEICKGKKKYIDGIDAQWVLDQQIQDPNIAVDHNVRPYLCPICHAYHLGHRKTYL